MDYNDISRRLKRTLISLKGRFDEDIDKHTHFHFYEKGNEQRVSITWGTEDENEVLNPIMIILHNLANIKDNLKNCFKEKGHDPQIVEDEINNSLHLQVLIDIVNQEKHGSPLRTNRSEKKPVITQVHRGFFMGSTIRDDDGNIIDEDGPPAMKINALIREENGTILFYLDELIETCYSKWITLAKKHGCRN